MPELKNVSWRKLEDRNERMIARMENMARVNTVLGGMSAQVLAKRLRKMPKGTDLRYVVDAVYSLSSGNPHPQYAAFECPECGSACLGKETALACCSHMEEDPEGE